jgi:hypothetical protein
VTPAAVEEFATDEGALIARVTDRREVDADGEVDVSFADPEDAVRDRLDEMSLSTAARDVESAVREDTVPDANVRETVKRRVEERLDGEGDLGAFEAVEPDAETDEDDDGKPAAESDDASEPAAESDDAGDDAEDGDESNGDKSDGDELDDELDGDEPEPDESDADPAEATDADSASPDGQVSMEDYL